MEKAEHEETKSIQQYADEEKLIRQFKNGNAEAFEELVTRYYADVYRVCYYYIKDMAESQDLSQEVFISVYKNLANFRHEVSLKAWILRIAFSKSMDFLRKKAISKQTRYIPQENLETIESEWSKIREGNPFSEGFKQVINNVLQELPEKARNIIELFYYCQCSCQEIAQVLNLSIPAVKTALFRARELLKEKLAPYYKLGG